MLIAALAVLVLGVGGTALAQATGGSEDGITSAQRERAGQAAIAAIGGGEVVKVERADGGRAAWEVEVLKAVPGFEGWLGRVTHARRGEVQLDANFNWIEYTNTGTGEVR